MKNIDLACLALDGFFDLERNNEGPFRWTRKRFTIAVPSGSFGFATLEFANNVSANRLRLSSGSVSADYQLGLGWQKIDVALDGAQISAELASVFHPPGDDRELGLMLRSVLFHSDVALKELRTRRQANFALNGQEFSAGAEILNSVPPLLRISLSKSCNIANQAACVYCAWDWAKNKEKGSPDLTPQLLREMGRFSQLAMEVTDCSIGEPPMEVEFADQLSFLTEGERIFEFTSNGQTLAAKKRRAMLGKQVRVYVSIDSATAEGYARYRDHRFQLVIENLTALCREKRSHNNLPEVIASFLVMSSNKTECKAFLDFMKDIGVDRVKFRTLSVDEPMEIERSSNRAGHLFNYDEECLCKEELECIGRELNAWRSQYPFDIIIEWEAFVSDQSSADKSAPICSEPWKTSYLLGRGIMPCCYGRRPIASWDDVDQKDVEGSLQKIFNNQEFRELRRNLAIGQLPKYCVDSHACPITKEYLAAQERSNARSLIST